MPFSRRTENDPCRLIAMIHVDALPGTPRSSRPLSEIIERAREEAVVLREAGVDAVLVENMHDRPYLKAAVGPEITAAMTMLAHEIRSACDLPCGIQILAGANREALAVALAAGLDFVRVEGFVFAHVADEGIMDGCAGELLRFRKSIGAEHVSLLADIKKKHSSHAITADVDIVETARAAEFFLGDGLIVTGTHTGEEASLEEVEAVRGNTRLPVFVGSGVTAGNVETYAAAADGLIAGSDLKKDGDWRNPVDPARVARLVKALRG